MSPRRAWGGPRAWIASDPAIRGNRAALEAALVQLGGRLQGVCPGTMGQFCAANSDCDSAPGRGDGTCPRLAKFGPALTASNACTPFADMTVPLRQTAQGFRAGSKRLQLMATASTGQPGDHDWLPLLCEPKR